VQLLWELVLTGEVRYYFSSAVGACVDWGDKILFSSTLSSDKQKTFKILVHISFFEKLMLTFF